MEDEDYCTEELSGKNNQDYFYSLRLAHYFALDTPLDDVKSNSPVFFVENPYPISETHLPFYNHFDELLQKKHEYVVKLETCRKEFRSDKRLIPLRDNKKSHYGIFPQYLVDTCNGNIRDPDICFPDNCGYNWYYTGGVLDVITLGNNNYVVTPDGKNNVRFTKTNLGSNTVLETNFNVGEPIYCLKCSPISNDSLLLTLRRKYRVSVILGTSTNDDDDFCSCLQFESRSDISYCDAKLNSKSELLFTLKADGCTETTDIRTGKIINQYYHCIDDSNIFSFGQIHPINSDTLIFSNRSEIIITDNRFSGKALTRLKDNFCDDICTFIHNDDNFLYVATKHHLMKYDLRKTETVATYAHMLESDPYLISCVKHKNSDLICLANQNTKVLIQCDEINTSLPLLLPSINDTHREMSLKRKTHNYRNLEERLLTPTIGLKWQENEENRMTLFSVNTAGDIFQQQISTKRLHSHPENMLSDWIEKLPHNNTEVHLTEFSEATKVKRSFNWIIYNEKEKAKFTSPVKNDFVISRKVYSEDNYFGSHLEEIWLLADDVTDEEEIPQVDSSKKVSAWLSAQENFNESFFPNV